MNTFRITNNSTFSESDGFATAYECLAPTPFSVSSPDMNFFPARWQWANDEGKKYLLSYPQQFRFNFLGKILNSAWKQRGKNQNNFNGLVSVSDPDPDLCGSVLKWLPWKRIRIRIGKTGPDPGQSKWCQKRGKNRWFQVKKSINHFAKGLMILTWTWKSSIDVYKQ